jgi:DDE superfamily endonuclease
MRLLQSVLPTLRQTKQPQQKFIAHLLGLLLMLQGHATFRHLSRYSSYHERTFSRWYARDFAFVSLNKTAITRVIAPDHEQALVLDARFVAKSGKKTSGLGRFWHNRHRRTAKGLAISALAWLDMTDSCAYGLSVAQTPTTDQTTDPEATRIEVSLAQLTRVVSAHHLHPLRYVITDGSYRQQQCTGGIRDLGLHQSGTLRLDAHLRYLYQGPQRPGPGRPQTYDGKGHWDDLTRFEKVETEEDPIVSYHQVLNHGQFQRNLRVVLVVDTKHNRRAMLFSTDVTLDALTLYRYDKARFHIELLFRDAKQFTGLPAWQARSQAKLNLHFNASLRAVTLAKLEAHQQNGAAVSVFSMASLKRRAFNQHLIERISQH